MFVYFFALLIVVVVVVSILIADRFSEDCISPEGVKKTRRLLSLTDEELKKESFLDRVYLKIVKQELGLSTEEKKEDQNERQ